MEKFRYASVQVEAPPTVRPGPHNTEADSLSPAVQVLPWGKARVIDGRKFRTDEEDFKAILDDLASRKNPVPVVVEHGEDRVWGNKAAGRALDFHLTKRGLYCRCTFSAAALEEIRSGARTWISPTFNGKADAEGFIHPRVLLDVSLTSTPAIDGMDEVAASVSMERATAGASAFRGVFAAASSLDELNMLTKSAVNALVSKGVPFEDAAAAVHGQLVTIGMFGERS